MHALAAERVKIKGHDDLVSAVKDVCRLRAENKISMSDSMICLSHFVRDPTVAAVTWNSLSTLHLKKAYMRRWSAGNKT
jgi:hypothetical protein